MINIRGKAQNELTRATLRKVVEIFYFGNDIFSGIPVHREKVRKTMFLCHLQTFFKF